MALMLRNARVIDPQVDLDEVCDILIRDGRVVEVGRDLEMPKGVERDLSGKILVPGLVDIHVHLRDPGLEQKEDIASGTRAAAHGGFTTVACMPNTKPTIDNGQIVEYVKSRAAEVGKCRVEVVGACTQGLKGETLSEMGDMVAHGACAFTDDGRGVQDSGMMRRVMDYAKQFDRVVMSHCQDEGLVGAGQVNEGAASTRLGLLGWPAEGEEIQIARDIAVCRLTGCALHVQHLSTARGLDMVRAAKAEGLPVTCEVTPHHLLLCEDDIGQDYNTSFKAAAHARRLRGAHPGRRGRHGRRDRHRPRPALQVREGPRVRARPVRHDGHRDLAQPRPHAPRESRRHRLEPHGRADGRQPAPHHPRRARCGRAWQRGGLHGHRSLRRMDGRGGGLRV